MDILHLIDRLEELVAEARRMPIGQGVVIDRRRLLELVDHMRSSVPWEVKDARGIVDEKEAILEEAAAVDDDALADGHAARFGDELFKAVDEVKDVHVRAGRTSPGVPG